MAPAYKLIYFDRLGGGEAARFLFKYGGIEFEDVRIQKEDWPEMKEKMPFGQLPVLEHDGKQVNQSVAICRYLGQIVKLAGKDDWENLEINAAADCVCDMRFDTFKMVAFEIDPEVQKTKKKIAVDETFPDYLARLEALVKRNNGFLALGRLTWADLYLAALCPRFDSFVGGNIFANYPNLQALRDKVEALPPIKNWIQARPNNNL